MSLSPEQIAIIDDVATSEGISHSWLHAIVEKESSGIVSYKIGAQDFPAIRIEGHYFYKYLKDDPAKLSKGSALGIARKGVGEFKNPRFMQDRYSELIDMRRIDEEAAFRSISIGIGQVMGANFAMCGFGSATSMFKFVQGTGFKGQLLIMTRFIKADKTLMRCIKNDNYNGFAKAYNGPKAPPSYGRSIKLLVERYRLVGDVDVDIDVRRVQKLGFVSIQEFQATNNLKIDGDAGPVTKASIDELEVARHAANMAPVVKAVNKVAAAGGTIVTGLALDNAGDFMTGIQTMLGYVDQAKQLLASAGSYGPKVLIVLGVGAAGYFAYKVYSNWNSAKEKDAL
jgi:hypothetical protein